MLDVLFALGFRQNACVHHVLNQTFVEFIEVLLDLFKLRELLEQLIGILAVAGLDQLLPAFCV